MQRLLTIFMLALVAGLCAPGAIAGPPTAQVQAEIAGLLSRLEASGCDVERNGTWHNAAEAKAHMLDKLNYIEGRTTLHSTEQFIDLAASKSSLSGKPYMVRCAGGTPEPSGTWLRAQLAALRAAAKPKVAP